MEQDISKQLRLYKLIYAALVVLSVTNVVASYMPKPVSIGIFIVLILAGCQASLAASFFMHLLHEKPIVLVVLVFTVFFLVSMMGLIVFNHHNIYDGAYYVTG